jgi:hypothetical protein
MAFSDAQKVSIRRYLGYPLGYYQLNTALESMMDKIGAIAVEQAAVETILTELVTVDTALAASGSTTSTMGGLKKVDEIEWYDTTTQSTSAVVDALARGKMLVERLRQCFGVPLCGRYFASAPPRDSEMALG